MKKLLFPLFMLAMIVTSCEKDPDMNKLDSDYSVYTDYDNSVHFNEFSTYYLPDSILVPDNSLKANYWKDENAQNIISAVAHEMEQKGYVRTEDKEKANVGIQLSYAQQRIQITTGGWYGGNHGCAENYHNAKRHTRYTDSEGGDRRRRFEPFAPCGKNNGRRFESIPRWGLWQFHGRAKRRTHRPHP